jgi:hypothetical protein
VKVGDLAIDKGFQPWAVSPEEAIETIQREWDKLGHDPDLGDIAWFTVTG